MCRNVTMGYDKVNSRFIAFVFMHISSAACGLKFVFHMELN